MNWFDMLIVYPVGILYPSFRLYVALARRKPIEQFLKHFVVFAICFSLIEIMNFVLGSFWVYVAVKLVALWLLVGTDFKGSTLMFDNLVATFMLSMPFLVQFGYRSHYSSSSQLGKDLSTHFHQIFIQRYHRILDEIDN